MKSKTLSHMKRLPIQMLYGLGLQAPPNLIEMFHSWLHSRTLAYGQLTVEAILD